MARRTLVPACPSLLEPATPLACAGDEAMPTLARRELQLMMMAIVEHLVALLRLFEPLADLHQELIAVSKLCVHHW
jgi:fructoselysine-6-P-deglycase FrlB-like protein